MWTRKTRWISILQRMTLLKISTIFFFLSICNVLCIFLMSLVHLKVLDFHLFCIQNRINNFMMIVHFWALFHIKNYRQYLNFLCCEFAFLLYELWMTSLKKCLFFCYLLVIEVFFLGGGGISNFLRTIVFFCIEDQGVVFVMIY